VGTRASKGSSLVRLDPEFDLLAIPSQELRRVGLKAGVFTLCIESGHKQFGTGLAYGMSSSRFDSWDLCREEFTIWLGNEDPALQLRDDTLFLEFDPNMKSYYFGRPQAYQHALFNTWETFTHPEHSEAIRAAAAKSKRGISLQDCLDEFTKEEQLREDDPWYCP